MNIRFARRAHMAKCLCGPRAFFVMAHDCDALSERMLSMKRTLLLLLAIALMAFTLPALAGDNATGSDAAATESANADTASGAGMSLRDMVGSIIDSGQTAGQDTDGQTTQEHSGGAASTDAGVSSGSIFDSIIDSGQTAQEHSVGAASTDAGVSSGSIFGSIIGSGNAAKLIPLSQATPDDARLIEIARGVSDTMFKICAHESYIDIYTSDDDLKAMMADMIPADGCEPASIAVLRMSPDKADSFINMLFTMTGTQYNADEAGLHRLIIMSIRNMLPNSIIMQAGADWQEISAIANCTDVQQLDGMEPGLAYVIFDYGEDLPAAVVSACIDEDGLATLDASPCMLTASMREALLSGQQPSTFDQVGVLMALMSQTVYTPD